MKITMTVTLPADNEIQFFDVCTAAAAKLAEMGQEALRTGDHEPFRGTRHSVYLELDEAEPEAIGTIQVSR